MRRRAVSFLFVFLLFASPPLRAQSLTPDKIKAIEQAVSAEMAKQTLPGVSIAIGFNNQVQWAAGFGLADLENQIPITSATRIRLGSISKPITAVAVMQLWEQGKLNLDAPIQQYVPQFPAKQWPVTARQLLGHLGGIRHYQPGEIESVKYYLNRVDPLAIFANDPLIAEPGTRYSYSTYGFNLLGAAVELVAGQPFAAYLKQNVFTPAGMLSISADDTFELIPHRSRGYSLRGDGVLINCGLADTSNKIPAGGMIGTASDLVRFALALEAGKLVKPETMKLMFARQVLKDGKTTGYGLGFGIDPIDGKDRVGHSGGQQGTSTYLCLYPKEAVAIAVMINRDSANAMTIANAVGRLLLAP